MDSHHAHALITGASSGIGERFARQYAALGVPLILTARREERLQALAAELRAHVPVHVLSADMAEPGAAAELVARLHDTGLRVRILVNNAGYGLPGRYRDRDWSEHARFLRVMIEAWTELTWQLLPELRASGSGRIINVASFAALMPGAAGQTLYAPAKSFMLKLSESLSLENADAGLNVTALCPGFTWSEFHDVTGTRQQMDRLPGWMWLDPDQVVREAIDAVERGRVLAIPGWRYRLAYALLRHLPDQVLLGLMRRGSGRIRPVD
jgi:uncharacterized protein